MTHDEFRLPVWEQVQQVVEAGLSSTFVIVGEPKVDLSVKASESMELVIWTEAPDPGPNALEEIHWSTELRQGRRCLVVRTRNALLFRPFFQFTCTVVDRIQLAGADPVSALHQVMAELRALLEMVTVLSEDKQVGLMGELTFLRRLADVSDLETALMAWHRDGGSEHDFDLGRVDIEVKSTRSESRRHTISSLTQLLPTGSRPLYLCSVQFTAAAQGPSDTLTSMARSVAESIQFAAPHLVEAYWERLRSGGWRDDHALLYRTELRLRSAPYLVAVDDRCPALTPTALATLPPDLLARIGDVSYRIDVSGLGQELTETRLAGLAGV